MELANPHFDRITYERLNLVQFPHTFAGDKTLQSRSLLSRNVHRKSIEHHSLFQPVLAFKAKIRQHRLLSGKSSSLSSISKGEVPYGRLSFLET